MNGVARKTNTECDPVDVLELEFELPDAAEDFFETGRMLLIEYESGNVDFIGAPRETGRAEVSLPAEGEATITVTAISAAGELGASVDVDVSGLGHDREHACRVRTSNGLAAWWLVVAALWSLRRRRATPTRD